MSLLLGSLLPIGLMGAFYYFLIFRKMKGGSGGLFSFGKSKATPIQGEQTGVTVGNMAKQFGVTRQCMNHRARCILAALNELGGDPGQASSPSSGQTTPATPSWYRARQTRDSHDDSI